MVTGGASLIYGGAIKSRAYSAGMQIDLTAAAQMKGDSGGLTAVLVGAAAGLVVALFVQVVVIPFVQSRMRYGERWTDDANEFYAVVETQLPLAIIRLRGLHTLQALLIQMAIRGWQTATKPPPTGRRSVLSRRSRSAPPADELRFPAELETVKAETTAVIDLVGQYVGRLQFLAFRLTARYRLHPDRNPELHRLRTSVRNLRDLVKDAAEQDVPGDRAAGDLGAEWHKKWHAVVAANTELADLAEPFALKRRPPSRLPRWMRRKKDKEKAARITKD